MSVLRVLGDFRPLSGSSGFRALNLQGNLAHLHLKYYGLPESLGDQSCFGLGTASSQPASVVRMLRISDLFDSLASSYTMQKTLLVLEVSLVLTGQLLSYWPMLTLASLIGLLSYCPEVSDCLFVPVLGWMRVLTFVST